MSDDPLDIEYRNGVYAREWFIEKDETWFCGQCTGMLANAPIIAWHCTQDMAAFVQRTHAGLVSYPQCMRVGVKTAATAAYWVANAPDYKLRQAFCCR